MQALVQEVVDAVNAERSRYEQIKRFAVLPRDFTMEAGEITPTLKLKRRVVEEHFAAELEGCTRTDLVNEHGARARRHVLCRGQ